MKTFWTYVIVLVVGTVSGICISKGLVYRGLVMKFAQVSLSKAESAFGVDS